MKRRDVMEFVGGCLLMVLVWWLVWAYCRITPDQLSAEADLSAEMEAR